MTAEQIDRAAEALWRSEAKRTIDWLEAPRRERNEAIRRARIILDSLALAPQPDIEQARQTNAALAAANLQLKVDLVNARRDAVRELDRLLSRRVRDLYARAAAEGISRASKKGLNQRAEELGAVVGEIRAYGGGDHEPVESDH